MIDTKGFIPISIGCKGGSGSRVLREILTASPQIMMDQDTSLNAKDSQKCNAFFDKKDAPFDVRLKELDMFIESILDQIPHSTASQYKFFGWKRPKTIRHLDYIFQALPEMRFLHLIRDPAAIARGSLWRKGYKRRLMNGRIGPNFNYDKSILRRWVLANRPVWRKYKDHPGYFLVRYEDIITKPEETVPKIFDWLGVTEYDMDKALAFIKPSEDALNRGDDVDLSCIARATRELGYGYKLESKVKEAG